MFGFLRKKASAPIIRLIDTAYAAQCAELHAVSFAHPWSAEDFEQLLTDVHVIAHGALDADGKRLCGFILSRLVLDEAEVLTIAVATSLRRKGLGRSLLAANIGQLAGRGAKALFLEVDQDNLAARTLYKSFGFSDVGERKGYYAKADGTRGTALIMRRDL
jgi:ribosomal-protein-alanine N-acetyltransferase